MGLILPGDRSKVGYDRELAVKLGLPAGIILSRIIWSLDQKIGRDEKFFIDGKWWMYDSVKSFQEYSGLGRYQVLQAIKTLQEQEILEIGQHDHKFAERQNWYSVNTAKLMAVLSSIVRKPDNRKFSSVRKPDNLMSGNQTIDSPETRQSNVRKPDNTSLSNSLPDSLPEIHSKSPDEAPSAASVTLLKIKRITHSSEDLELAQSWLSYALREMKYTKPPKAWNAENFAEEIAKVRRSTGIEISKLHEVLKFVEGDDFWKPNAISPAGLLKKSRNDLRKIDNILSAMKGGRKNGTGQSIDYSANPERYKRFSDDKPW